MTVAITHLFELPALLPAAAQLIYDEFWTGKPGFSPAYFEQCLRAANDPDRIPLSLVASADGQFAGTINLIDNDDEQRASLWPWLAALAVPAALRGRGIGTQLVERLLAEAARLRIDCLYLGTDGPGFYLRLGAELHEQVRADFCILRFARLQRR